VLLFGVCGAYRAEHVGCGKALAVGELCLVAEDSLADEGVQCSDRFLDLDHLGFGSNGPWPMDRELTVGAAKVLGGLPAVIGATISSCSGHDPVAQAIAARTAGQVETMEGAAVAVVCARFRVPLVQLRCVSNLCGERSRGAFDVPGAAAKVQVAVQQLRRADWP
jgi:futalosine hydrolase